MTDCEHLNAVVADYADAVSAMGEEIRSLKMDKERLTASLAAAEGERDMQKRFLATEQKICRKFRERAEAAEAHNGVLIGLLRETYGPIASIKLFHPDGDERYPQLHRELLHKIRDTIESSTPAVGSLDRLRREGAEAAAKVVADHKQKQRATRIPNSASAYDTWLDYTCGQLEAEIRALYPEVAPEDQPKEK